MAFERARRAIGSGAVGTTAPEVVASGTVGGGDDTRSQLRRAREAYQSDPALTELRAEQERVGAPFIAAKKELEAARVAHRPLSDEMSGQWGKPEFPLKKAFKESLARLEAAKDAVEATEYAVQELNHRAVAVKKAALARHHAAYRKIHRAAVLAFDQVLKTARDANRELLAVENVIRADLGSEGAVTSCAWKELAESDNPGYTPRYENWKAYVKQNAGINL